VNRIATSTLALASYGCATGIASAASSQAGFDALLDAVVFFGGMLLLAGIAGALRIRDARAGLSPDEKKARLKARLPWVMGAFFGLVFYILFRTM
jgi:hypothetical protein